MRVMVGDASREVGSITPGIAAMPGLIHCGCQQEANDELFWKPKRGAKSQCTPAVTEVRPVRAGNSIVAVAWWLCWLKP